MTSRIEGDPDGRRIARRKAALLSEAGRTGTALQVLLQRAEFDSTPLDGLIAEVAKAEAVQMQRANGRIEPRNRFKSGVPQPLLANRPVQHLLLDEAGKSVVGSPIDAPVFSLAGVSVSEEVVAKYKTEADALKQEFFGTTEMTFHEPAMRRHDGPYHFNGNVSRQLEFDQAVDKLVLATEFVVFGAGIRKMAFADYFATEGLEVWPKTPCHSC